MRTFLAAAILALSTVFASAGDIKQKTDQMFAPTVQLNHNCSGVLFHSDRDRQSGSVETYVLTAKHCVMKHNRGDRSFISIFEYNDKNRKVSETVYEAEMWGKDTFSDLAVIKLRNDQKIFTNLATIADADSNLTFGQEVHVVGYPMGLSLTYTTGHLGYVEEPRFKDVSSSGQFYRATPEVFGGNSGGPMFTEIDGEYQVIGITTGMLMVPGAHMNFFTPIEEINEYLSKVTKTFKTPFRKTDD